MIPDDTITVWVARLDAHSAEEFEGLLSDDERRRAARLQLPQARRRFVVGRGLLRKILGAALGDDPAALRFRYGARGKPLLEQSAAPSPEVYNPSAYPTGAGSLEQAAGASPAAELHFNLAHSGDLALFALARGREVGVDIERLRAVPDALALAARFFAREEQAALLALPLAERDAGFLRIWTRKEAYLKAHGGGIAAGLGRFAVALDPDQPRLLHIAGDTQAAASWRLAEIAPPGAIGALAAQGQWRAEVFDWPVSYDEK